MKELTSEVINIDEWMEMNGPYLKPPVGNKCIFSGQLKVFLVAGPNQRSDYHVENGEEIFVMLKGDMILNVVEQGKPKSITIKEGEIFVLPKRIPHSPQRFEDTLGLVIERERLPEEMDCLRYYCDSNCDQVLYERWFHLVSLDIDIKQAIETFKDSVEFKTGQPTQKYDNSTVPHPDDLQIQTLSPICLLDWFKSNYQNISEGFASVWDSSKESKVGFYGPGKHIVVSVEHEIFVWHLGSHAKITIENNNRRKLAFNDSMIIGPGSVFTLTSDGPTFIASIKPTE